MIRARGHECVLASQVGIIADDDISVWADDRHMIVVSHDREFARRRIAKTIGRHVWLRCANPDACAVLEAQLDQILATLHGENCVVEVRPDSAPRYHPPRFS